MAGQFMRIQFDQIAINSVETNSGVFLGSNISANGWSSHNKGNSGFGKITDSTVRNSLNLVLDDDLIDSPIDDRDQFVLANGESRSNQESIAFHDINVNGLETNSSLSVGQTAQNGWSSHSKSNSGERSRKGINVSIADHSVISDSDYIDAPIQGNTIISGL